MNRFLLLIAVLAALPLTSCESIKAAWQDGRIPETLRIGARKVAIAAGGAVLQAAVNQVDAEKKGDFLQGLSGELWRQLPAVVNAETVEEIARTWTPQKSHWEGLASELAKDFAARQPKSEAEVRQILNGYAEGLYASSFGQVEP